MEYATKTVVVTQQVLGAAIFERQDNFARFSTFGALPHKQHTYLNSWPGAAIFSLSG